MPTACSNRVIRRFATLINRLPRLARTIWNRASTRDFNVGIQGGTTPHQYAVGLKPDTVRAIGDVNARLTVTVYGS